MFILKKWLCWLKTLNESLWSTNQSPIINDIYVLLSSLIYTPLPHPYLSHSICTAPVWWLDDPPTRHCASLFYSKPLITKVLPPYENRHFLSITQILAITKFSCDNFHIFRPHFFESVKNNVAHHYILMRPYIIISIIIGTNSLSYIFSSNYFPHF